jgi:peptide/nickel transport system ATP-binding protein
MYVGQLVELAPMAAVFARPRHPYTAALMRAVPVPDPRVRGANVILRGEVPSPASPPSGCYFHPRCQFADDRCRRDAPSLRELSPGHFARCHLAEQLTLGAAAG